MTKQVLDTMVEKMNKSVAVYRKELASMRAGRANPQLLDRILVDYYGSPTPINQVANISIPEPRIIQIAPWEQSMLKVIEKEIQKSDLGINPTNDGKIIRLLLPELTEEVLAGADLVMITASHSNVDYDFVQKHAKLVFDTKNAAKKVADRSNIEVL